MKTKADEYVAEMIRAVLDGQTVQQQSGTNGAWVDIYKDGNPLAVVVHIAQYPHLEYRIKRNRWIVPMFFDIEAPSQEAARAIASGMQQAANGNAPNARCTMLADDHLPIVGVAKDAVIHSLEDLK